MTGIEIHSLLTHQVTSSGGCAWAYIFGWWFATIVVINHKSLSTIFCNNISSVCQWLFDSYPMPKPVRNLFHDATIYTAATSLWKQASLIQIISYSGLVVDVIREYGNISIPLCVTLLEVPGHQLENVTLNTPMPTPMNPKPITTPRFAECICNQYKQRHQMIISDINAWTHSTGEWSTMLESLKSFRMTNLNLIWTGLFESTKRNSYITCLKITLMWFRLRPSALSQTTYTITQEQIEITVDINNNKPKSFNQKIALQLLFFFRYTHIVQ